MRLLNVAVVRDLLGFEDMTDINAAITGALEQTTPALEGYLESNFTRSVQTDHFYVPLHMQEDPSLSLRLYSGLVLAGSITALAWEDGGVPAEGTTITTLVPHSDRGLARGILQDMAPRYGTEVGPRIQVTYSVGFEADTDDEKLYNQSQVPDWLKQAASLNALIVLDSHPLVRQAEIVQDIQTMKERLSAILTRYRRYAPSAVLPE